MRASAPSRAVPLGGAVGERGAALRRRWLSPSAGGAGPLTRPGGGGGCGVLRVLPALLWGSKPGSGARGERFPSPRGAELLAVEPSLQSGDSPHRDGWL